MDAGLQTASSYPKLLLGELPTYFANFPTPSRRQAVQDLNARTTSLIATAQAMNSPP
jgi:hypothetical protein